MTSKTTEQAAAYAKGHSDATDLTLGELNQLRQAVGVFESTITTLQQENQRLRALVPEWVSCQGTDDIPEGNWLVKLEREVTGHSVFPLIKDKQFCIIGTAFAWDMPLVIAYMPTPTY